MDEKKRLQERFLEILDSIGIKNVKDIPSGIISNKKEHKEVWIIK